MDEVYIAWKTDASGDGPDHYHKTLEKAQKKVLMMAGLETGTFNEVSKNNNWTLKVEEDSFWSYGVTRVDINP